MGFLREGGVRGGGSWKPLLHPPLNSLIKHSTWPKRKSTVANKEDIKSLHLTRSYKWGGLSAQENGAEAECSCETIC